MAIKINDITINGDVYFNGNKVDNIYIDGKLAWTAKPTIGITVTVYRKNPIGFRLVAEADRNVNSDVTIIVNVGGVDTPITIHAGSKIAMTPWLPGYAIAASLSDYYPTEDSEYKYFVSVGDPITSEPMFNNIITGYCYVEQNNNLPHHLLVATAQYLVGPTGVSCSFDTGVISPVEVSIAPLTREGSYLETSTTAYICDWIDLGPDFDDSYYYIQGPSYFQYVPPGTIFN